MRQFGIVHEEGKDIPSGRWLKIRFDEAGELSKGVGALLIRQGTKVYGIALDGHDFTSFQGDYNKGGGLMARKERYIQVGLTALRDENGGFLPAVPLYIKAEDGAEEKEQKLMEDIGKLLGARMRQYIASCEAAGVRV